MSPRIVPPSPSARIAWLEGLRGLAALQVLLLHLLGAFWLSLVEDDPLRDGLASLVRHSPLYLLYDGETAVHLFFLLSGWVLTAGFAAQWRRPAAAMAGRALRLGLPAAGASLVAFLSFHAFGTAHGPAGTLLGSSWLSGNWQADGGLGSLLWETGPGALLLGFADCTGVAFLAPWLPSNPAAYNAPLWTLSFEVQGSVLVLALVGLRACRPRLWPVATGAAALLCLRSPLLGFVLGHALAAAPAGVAGAWRRLPRLGRVAIGLAALLGGTALAVEPGAGPGFVALAAARLPLLPALSPEALRRSLAATLELAGLLALPVARHWLETPAMLALGRLSFPVYLLHWPMIMGPGAAAALAAEPWLGIPGARLAGLLVAAGLTLAAAVPAQPLDAAAMRLGRLVRRRLSGERPMPTAGGFAVARDPA